MRSEQAPSPLGVATEPRSQGRVDPFEIGRPSGDRDDRDPERVVDGIEVDDVEPADDGAVEQERPETVPGPQRPDQRDHGLRPVGPVDPDAGGAHRLHVRGGGDDNRRDRSIPIGPSERAIIDRDDARVLFRERAPQR